jgi:cytochrome b-561 domain-containing protein 2
MPRNPDASTVLTGLWNLGILTLQPTSQPKTKAAGLARHQAAIFLVGFPSILLGTSAVAYNKWINNKEHMTTWHGVCRYKTIGYVCGLKIHIKRIDIWVSRSTLDLGSGGPGWW